MILTAIKEMKVGKGASINAIFAYLRTMFRYDPIKNRNHIKKSLAKLISEELVEQVKGRGLAGSFKFGKKYKETKKRTPVKQKPVGVLIKVVLGLFSFLIVYPNYILVMEKSRLEACEECVCFVFV